MKTWLDSGCVDTIDAPTQSKNQHENFTRTQSFTFIDEKCWLPARTAPHDSSLTAHSSLLSRVLTSSHLFLLCISDIATTFPTKRLTKEVLTLYIWYEALQRGLLMYVMWHIIATSVVYVKKQNLSQTLIPCNKYLSKPSFSFHSAFLFWKIWLSQK